MASPTIFSRYQQPIEKELQAILAQRHGLLYDMMRREFGWMDAGHPSDSAPPPRLHAISCLLMANALSGASDKALPAAAAVELVHSFTVTHKDFQDAVTERDGRASAWLEWGPGQAINLGDGLYALGRAALFRLSAQGVPPGRVLQALEALDKACFTLCQGQYMDLAFQEQMDVSVSSYMKMAEAKTGALMGCAMELGGIAAGADALTLNALRGCGQKLGVALQVRRDILDVWAGKVGATPGPEVFNKRKVYPVVQLLDKSAVSIKRQLGAIYFKRVLEPTDVNSVLKALEENGARAASQKAVEDNVSEGLGVIDRLSVPPASREEFRALGHYITGLER
jgi:geranylgeranyl diphosphate synthase type I